MILDSLSDHVSVDPDTGCHIWQRATTRDGYAHAWNGQRLVYVHRWVWERANGPAPEGVDVDHVCFNSSCVNLNHLRSLDSLTNARRQRSALKTHCINGHEFTSANTYRRPSDGRRSCRICRVARTKTYRAKVRAA